MSPYAIIPDGVLNALPSLSHSAVKLACVIGRYMNGDGSCYPSTATLMTKAGIKNWQTFSRARAQLKKLGLLSWKTSAKYRSLEYTWTPSMVEGLKPSTAEGDAPSTAEGQTTQLTTQLTHHHHKRPGGGGVFSTEGKAIVAEFKARSPGATPPTAEEMREALEAFTPDDILAAVGGCDRGTLSWRAVVRKLGGVPTRADREQQRRKQKEKAEKGQAAIDAATAADLAKRRGKK